jgi:hypothetical protein
MANCDPYVWVGPSSGSWNTGANWEDQTTGAAGSVPGLGNAVTFGVDTEAQQIRADDTVTGTGWSASLGLYGALTLSGTFRTMALNLNIFYQPQDTYLTSTLTVTGAGNSLTAGSVHAVGNLDVSDGAVMNVVRGYDIASGPAVQNDPQYELYGIDVDGAGSKLTIGGILSTDNASDLLVTDSGDLEATRMILRNMYSIAGYQVDAQSTIEVGTLGDAAAGTWTIDANRFLTVDNGVRLSAPEFVVNGVIDNVGGLDLTGSPGTVTGSGSIRIEASALLTIGQSGAELNVVFMGSGAELGLADGTSAFNSTIRRFASGDSISVTGPSFDSATWSGGVLSLFEDATLVGTLKMAGSYSSDTFSVSNNVITLDSAPVPNSRQAAAAPKSLQLFMQALASSERSGGASNHPMVASARHTDHPLLAATVHR